VPTLRVVTLFIRHGHFSPICPLSFFTGGIITVSAVTHTMVSSGRLPTSHYYFRYFMFQSREPYRVCDKRMAFGQHSPPSRPTDTPSFYHL
jgi:hypothetical protein